MDSLADVARRLAELERHEQWRVARFDSAASLVGRIAVLPSAFNPPTRAHFALLDLAAPVRRTAALLSTRNVDKGIEGAPLVHRVGMLLAAQADQGYAVLAANAARIADQGVALRSAYPDAVFDFIVGYDTLIRLFDPRYYTDMPAELDAFFAHHRLLAANRGEVSLEELEVFLNEPDVARYRDAIEPVLLADEPAQLSSTQARGEFLGAEQAESDVVQPEVERYVREHNLYRAL